MATLMMDRKEFEQLLVSKGLDVEGTRTRATSLFFDWGRGGTGVWYLNLFNVRGSLFFSFHPIVHEWCVLSICDYGSMWQVSMGIVWCRLLVAVPVPFFWRRPWVHSRKVVSFYI